MFYLVGKRMSHCVSLVYRVVFILDPLVPWRYTWISINQSINQLINQSINRAINHSSKVINQSIVQSINRAITL